MRFLGRVSETELRGLYAGCRALLFPGEEDFGLTPLEAQASGRPVVAYAAGGALDTVLPGATGEFFAERTLGGAGRGAAPLPRGGLRPRGGTSATR